MATSKLKAVETRPRTRKSSSADCSTHTVSRVSVLESQVEDVTNTVDKLSDKVEKHYTEIQDKISSVKEDLRQDMEVKHEKLIEKIDAHSNASATQNEVIKSKISDLEKWRWMMIGGSLVLGYILAHVKIDKLF